MDPGLESLLALQDSGILASLPHLLESELRKFDETPSSFAPMTKSGGVGQAELVNVLSDEAMIRQLQQHIPSYETLKEHLNLSKGSIGGLLKGEVDSKSNVCGYQSLDAKEPMSEVAFPCETVKVEDSSKHELKNMRTDLLFGPSVPCQNTVRLELSAAIPPVSEQSLFLFHQVTTGGGGATTPLLGHIVPCQDLKNELGIVDEDMLSIVHFAPPPVSHDNAQATLDGKQKHVEEHGSSLGVERRSSSEGSHNQKWNADIMQQAVAAVRSGLMSSTGAAKHFNLPRTTLRRHLQPSGVAKSNLKMEGREPQCQKWNADVMDEAVSVVLSGQMSSTKAAKHYNLPRTTLRRYIRIGGVSRVNRPSSSGSPELKVGAASPGGPT